MLNDYLPRIAAEIKALAEADAPDDAEMAYRFDEIKNAALEALADLDVKVIEVDPYHGLEVEGSICWASTPGQVELWCVRNGFPFEWDRELYVTFEDRPDDETRKALKEAGFRYVKPRRAWCHKCFGRFPKCRDKAKAEAAA